MNTKLIAVSVGVSALALVGVGLVAVHHPKPPAPVVAGSGDCHAQGPDPDPVCTPGATNPAVTQANIGQTICVKGWTKKIRPPVSYTDQVKKNMMGSGTFNAAPDGNFYTYRGYNTGGNPSDFEEDHELALELGGAPTNPANLWPEPGGRARVPFMVGTDNANSATKDSFENSTRAAVCSGQIRLAQGQARFLGGHWYEAWVAAGRPG